MLVEVVGAEGLVDSRTILGGQEASSRPRVTATDRRAPARAEVSSSPAARNASRSDWTRDSITPSRKPSVPGRPGGDEAASSSPMVDVRQTGEARRL